MSTEEIKDDVKVEDQQTNEEVKTEEVVKEPSATEVEAREGGWKPLEEYEGDPDKWVDAKEFLRRGELFDKIDHLSRDLKDTKKALKALQAHHASVKETEFKRAIEQLKQEKKKAFEEGDADRIIEIDEQLQETKIQQQNEAQQAMQQAQQPDPRFLAWVDKNRWYAQDREMRQLADQIGVAHAAQNPGMTPDDVLKYVAKKIQTMYPEKFENPNRTKPSAVESAGRPSSKKVDTFELTEDEERVMKTFVRQGIMSKEDYIAELKKVRGVE